MELYGHFSYTKLQFLQMYFGSSLDLLSDLSDNTNSNEFTVVKSRGDKSMNNLGNSENQDRV